ncbi:SDR family NAD(P)-dependent oxidoreductase [Actinomadura sp. LD22]|uniref:SDR family NAD(P)-dependent oxidoreductase n=1 Tax=Actinomadura physcomitrii TaxID=2650748 RepID=A0A6I4M915_9ACTN|nr:SDR family oxidoreductase [Actinomadura physcomitrii]MWA00905.1 SDR family NAD(P)-dependent oxidoreductase [Actinomadura physcomitrii]
MSEKLCDGRVVVITGAGNGLGRAHALAFAAEGAKVVVNDLGSGRDGDGASGGPAQRVADEIVAAGGAAVANTDDISSWDGAGRLVRQAVEEFGGLDVLVNNAGILRDRMVFSMTERDWDSVIAVHLKGTFATLHHAAAYWREQAKKGLSVDARVINTTSPSGLFGSVGQTNYGAAKAGIASMTIIAAAELARYGVTVNAVAPTAMTRLTEDIEMMRQAAETADLSPEAISPLVVWLGSAASKDVTGRVFAAMGNRITVLEGWVNGPAADSGERWAPAALTGVVPALVAKAAPNAGAMGGRA